MLIVISGTPAAGKSSVARALAKKFPKSAHISVDEMRGMVVGGNILPWEDKDLRMFMAFYFYHLRPVIGKLKLF